MATFLERLQSGADSIVGGVSRQAAKYNNRPFLKAVLSGMALIIAADGKVEDAEVDDATEFVTTHPALAAFDGKEKQELFSEYLTKAQSKITQIELFGYVGALKSDAGAADTLLQLVIVIANSDDDFAESEQKMVGRIARTVGLKAEDYI